jgi:hypothetical protein
MNLVKKTAYQKISALYLIKQIKCFWLALFIFIEDPHLKKNLAKNTGSIKREPADGFEVKYSLSSQIKNGKITP